MPCRRTPRLTRGDTAPTVFGHEYARVVGVGDALKTVVAGQRTSRKGHIMCGVRGYRLVRRDHHCMVAQGTAANARIQALNAYSTTDNALHEHTGEQA